MASKTPPPPAPLPPSIPLEQGLAIIGDLIAEGKDIQKTNFTQQRTETWYASAREALKKTFGEDSYHLSTLRGQVYVMYGHSMSEIDIAAKRFNERIEALEAIESAGRSDLRRKQQFAVSSNEPAAKDDLIKSRSNEVFIVHGHNTSIKETCARLLEKIHLKPVILHEQANEGMTVIEKFEKHSSVGFAVVLLTADDEGRIIGTHDLSPRARQNVIFEMGYFSAKLGRKHVCALCEDGVEIPSDLGGVIYIKLDSAGAWKFQLAKELKLSGLDVDMNKVM